jgi:hypothetical protein
LFLRRAVGAGGARLATVGVGGETSAQAETVLKFRLAYQSDMVTVQGGIGLSWISLAIFGAPETLLEEPRYGYVHFFAAS